MVEDSKKPSKDGELEWINTEPYIPEYQPNEHGLKEKIKRKIKENPFVPAGMLATTVALTLGLKAMRRGDKKRSQFMMRARVGAQGLTVIAILAGVLISASKKKKELEPNKKT